MAIAGLGNIPIFDAQVAHDGSSWRLVGYGTL